MAYETRESLPVPMTGSGFASEFTDAIDASVPGDEVGLSTMQLAPQPDMESSPVLDAADAMFDANERGVSTKVIVDESYVSRMTRINNRDFPNYIPLLSRADRAERVANHQAAGELLTRLADVGVLAGSGVRPTERGYTPRMRHAASMHPLQALAVRHAKEAHIARYTGDSVAWITTANFTDSDLTDPHPDNRSGMNNLAFRVEGDLARFAIRSLADGFEHTSGTHRYKRNGITIIHDVNNSGEPARLPGIIQEALVTVDPRRSDEILDPTLVAPKAPTHVVLLSQYLPDGLMLSALDQATDHADVYVPKQPADDHRAKSFPYNLHHKTQGRKIDKSGIESDRRDVSSHVKAVVARYDDGSARILCGTDNFATHLQKMVRNEELAVVIDLDLKDGVEMEYFTDFVDLLFSIGEISEDARAGLLEG